MDPTLAMLASVDPRSRPTPVTPPQLLKMDGPKGELEPGRGANWLRCGIEPARRRERRVEPFDVLSIGSSPGDGVLLKGLCDGVFLADLAPKPGTFKWFVGAPPGENREGTVPARGRRVWGRESGVGSCAKSGKPSVGDSGIFSRNGVELPLVGGPPQGFNGSPGTPSWA